MIVLEEYVIIAVCPIQHTSALKLLAFRHTHDPCAQKYYALRLLRYVESVHIAVIVDMLHRY